ncbi:hypothetical protein PAAG_05921 [Paracoccidioides lutzii Pb01]|uniref:Uncharacterized protein n=1 Tax=Paracoccidioides lutzii (strain ATCC MYA-826 / Pb01) TaxID=502779 RepID=C1H580_PARBA|nr:hypothetical protein PAAG_05921 [Paracoccidioides lutzii Pb01]EEH34874.1 hypothetical protein PAAG_05921 [Paracoccidioides lutzii Pb01]
MGSRPGSIAQHLDRQNQGQSDADYAGLPSSPPDEGVVDATLLQALRKTSPNTSRKRTSQTVLTRPLPFRDNSARMKEISGSRTPGSPQLPHISRVSKLNLRRNQQSSQQLVFKKTNNTQQSPGAQSEENHFQFSDQLSSPLLLLPQVSPNGTRWTTVPMADEPISSGFNSPSFPNPTAAPRAANSQFLSRYKAGKAVPLRDSEARSSPLNLNEAKLTQCFQNTSISDVQCWLDGLNVEPPSDLYESDDSPSVSRMKREVYHSDCNIPQSQVLNGHHFSPRVGSDKENMSPSSSTFAAGPKLSPPLHIRDEEYDAPDSVASSTSPSFREYRSKLPVPSTPVLVRKTQKCFTSPRAYVRGRISPTLPRGHYVLPARRKKVRSSSAYDPMPPFEIEEDKDADIPVKPPIGSSCPRKETWMGLRELSPHVTPFRKGQGPKRSRCSSYYDEDFLQETKTKEETLASSKLPVMENGRRFPIGDSMNMGE